MTLKTATLCALIGIIINVILGICNFAVQNIMQHNIPLVLHQVLWLAQMVILNGSIILFLAVLYSKQNEVKG
jgi:hypothetical protein